MSLQKLMKDKGQMPYNKSIKVKVIARENELTYKNEKKEDRVLLNCSIADESESVTCTVYDKNKFQRFSEGSSLILRNIIKKVDGIVVTSNTKVFPSGDINIPQELIEKGKHIIHPPPAPTVPVNEALHSPSKVRVSVKGRLLQEEPTREVFVKEEPVKVKNIMIEDSTTKCKVALWRNCADADIKPGDYIHITDVVTNTFRNEVSLTTTSKTTISKTDCPSEEKTYNVISVCCEEEDNTMTFLLEDDSILSLPSQLVQDALPGIGKEEIENYIVNKCKPTVSLKCTWENSKCTKVDFSS